MRQRLWDKDLDVKKRRVSEVVEIHKLVEGVAERSKTPQFSFTVSAGPSLVDLHNSDAPAARKGFNIRVLDGSWVLV